MKKKYATGKLKLTAILCCSAILCGGCSYTVMPKKIPLFTASKTKLLTGVSCIITNVERDQSYYAIPTESGEKSVLRANRQAWSGMLVEALAGELSRRGAQVSSRALLTINLAMPEIIFARNEEVYQLAVKILVSSSTGWQKNYEGAAKSGPERFESVSTMVNRLAGQALANAANSVLTDPEFLAHVQGT
jgi:hypothetical protein